jgi:F0F1-type ATP synthase membrane subunit a
VKMPSTHPGRDSALNSHPTAWWERATDSLSFWLAMAIAVPITMVSVRWRRWRK